MKRAAAIIAAIIAADPQISLRCKVQTLYRKISGGGGVDEQVALLIQHAGLHIVFQGSGMDGDGDTLGGVIVGQQLELGMADNQLILVLEQGLGELIHRVLAQVGGGDQNGLDGHAGHFIVHTLIGPGGQVLLNQEVVMLREVIHGLLGQRDHGEVHAAGGQLGDGHSGGAGHGEGRVDLAVLQLLGGVAEGAVSNIDVVIGHAVGFQNLAGIEFGTGAPVAHADGLAGQLGHVGNAAAGGDLNRLIVQAGHPKGIRLRLLEHVLAVVGIGQHIGLKNSQLILVIGNALDVLLGGASGGGGHVQHITDNGIQYSTHTRTYTVISTGGASGGQNSRFTRAATRGRCACSARSAFRTGAGTRRMGVATAGQRQTGRHRHG